MQFTAVDGERGAQLPDEAPLDLPRGLRVKVVSPPWVTETLIARGMDPSIGIPADQVAQAYLASVEGTMTGQTLDPRQIAAV